MRNRVILYLMAAVLMTTACKKESAEPNRPEEGMTLRKLKNKVIPKALKKKKKKLQD